MPFTPTNVRFWGFGAHILILQEFSTFPAFYPHADPPWQNLLADRPANSKAARPPMRVAMTFPAQI
jgi:hypothetical protein